jgi:hypothetical protein
MPPAEFAKEMDRLYNQVKPLYEALHCYVRRRLAETYGADLVPPGKPIPVQLLGNLWAQQWGGIYPLVAPKTEGMGYDLTKLLEAKKVDAKGLVGYGEWAERIDSLARPPLGPLQCSQALHHRMPKPSIAKREDKVPERSELKFL